MNIESKYNHYLNFREKDTIYNALAKSSININENFNLQRLLDSNDFETISVLKKLGMIIEDSTNELDVLQYLFNRNFFGKNSFLNMVLVPGLDCNFKCPYCFEKVSGKESLFETRVDRYFSALKLFAKNNFMNYKTIEISLFGGEPLLFSEYIFDYFEYVEMVMPEISFFCSIVTNGALLNIKMVHKLLQHKCRSIQVTIDGCRTVHDKNRIFKNGTESYDLLMNNINTIVPIIPEDCIFNLRINLNNVTVDEVRKTLDDIDSHIRKKIRLLFRPIYSTETYKHINKNTFNNLKPYFDLACELGYNIVRNTYYYQACEACSGDDFFFIMPDLTLWKCINDISFEQACIGKVTEEGYLHFEADKLIQWYVYSNCFNEEKCTQCKLLPDCFGGCVLYRAKNGRRLCKDFEMAALPYLY